MIDALKEDGVDHIQIDETTCRGRTLATVTIQRANKRNALHHALWDELRRAALQLSDRRPAAVLLTGQGDHFCAGMDLSPDNRLLQRIQQPMLTRDGMKVAEIIEELKAAILGFARLPCPVIAAIEGACVGAGLELALAADLRVASDTAFFSLPETRIGMVPDVGGTVNLIRLIGPGRAADIVLTGRTVDAEEALSLGLVNRVTEAGEALEQSREVAELVLHGSPTATRQALLVLRQAAALSDEEAFTLETNAGARAICSGEAIEGMAAFAQKREPRW